MLSPGIIFAIGSMIVIAVVDTFMRKATRALGSYFSSMIFIGLAIIPLLFLVVAVPPSGIAPIYLLYAVLGGLAYALGLVLVLKTLETEQASNTWALSNIGLIPIILLGAIVLAEPINMLELFGILGVVFGSLMITITKDMKFNKKLLPAIAGNVLFAVYFIFSTYAVSQAHAEYTLIFPLAYASAFIALMAYGTAKSSLKPAIKKLNKSNLLWFVVAIGLLGGVSQALWMFVVIFKTVALGGAIQVFEPALVVVLAYMVYRERLTPLQSIGVIISLAGALAVSVL